jgi:hypothetical protein
MAKPPSRRRGITLNPRADLDASPDLLGARAQAPDTSGRDGTGQEREAEGTGPDPVGQTIEQPLEQLRRISRHIDEHWKRIAEESERQWRQLEQQRGEIALQLSQLQDLQRRHKTSRRVGASLALLTLATAVGLSLPHWHQIKGSAEGLSRTITGVAGIQPQLKLLNEQLANLTAETERVGGTMASLGEDFSRVHADVGALRGVVDTLSEHRHTASSEGAAPRRTAYTPTRSSATRGSPYRAMRPPLPW